MNRPKETSKEYQLTQGELAVITRLHHHIGDLNETIMQLLSAIAIDRLGFKEGDKVSVLNLDMEHGKIVIQSDD